MRTMLWLLAMVACLELAREAWVLGKLERPSGPDFHVRAMPEYQSVFGQGAWDVREADNFGLSPAVVIDCLLTEGICRETAVTDFGGLVTVDSFDYSITENTASLVRYANETECVTYSVMIDIPSARAIATRTPKAERPDHCGEAITVTMELVDGKTVAAERRRIEASREFLPLLGWTVR